MLKRKKITRKLENVRKFIFVHRLGKEEIFAKSPVEAKGKAYQVFIQKGMQKKDITDFYEER